MGTDTLVNALQRRCDSLTAKVKRLQKERKRIQDDERVVTCVFCGHEYPPGTPGTNHEALKAHVAECPEHPAAAFRRRAEAAEEDWQTAERTLNELLGDLTYDDLEIKSLYLHDGIGNLNRTLPFLQRTRKLLVARKASAGA